MPPQRFVLSVALAALGAGLSGARGQPAALSPVKLDPGAGLPPLPAGVKPLGELPPPEPPPVPTPAAAAADPAKPPPKAVAGLEFPRWDDGDTWTLRADYRPLELGAKALAKKKAAGAGDAPKVAERLGDVLGRGNRLVTYWTYKVTSVGGADGGVRRVVRVKDKDGHKDALAALLFWEAPAAAGVPGEFGLSRGKFWSRVAGRSHVAKRVFASRSQPARPAIPEDSIIPHGFPAFPAWRYPGAPDYADVYEDTREAGGLKFAFDSEQRVTAGVSAEAVGGEALATRLKKAGLPAEDLTLVELSRAFDSRRLRQLWAPGYPWAIWGENGWSSYILVYQFTRKGRR